jgi:hypothetical protein
MRSDSSRIRASRLRPLAWALACTCAAAAPSAEATRPSDMAWVRELGARFNHMPLQSPPASPNVLTVTNCDDDGPGSLRVVAEGAADGDTIDLTQLACSRISLTTGTITLGQRDLVIRGPGRNRMMIDAYDGPAGSLGNVFAHLGGGWFSLEGVTVAGGWKYEVGQHVRGGCIYSNENVQLRDVTVTHCDVLSAGDYAALGGGVFAQGFVDLDHSTIYNNQSLAQNDGYSSGGGVYALGGIRSAYSLVSNNFAIGFGARPSFGGGLFARGYAGIFETAVVQNHSARAAGMALADVGNSFSLVFQSTVSGNRASDVNGGMYSRRPLYLYNSTIADNWAAHTTIGSDAKGVGLHWDALQSLIMVSSIVTANTSDDPGAFDLAGPLSTPPGVFFAGSNNIITYTNQAPPPDTIWGPAELGPLTDNGGPTPTHALGSGSAGIDAGAMPTLGSFTYDQRGEGFGRWVGNALDIGAFESDPDRIFTNGFN